MNTGVDPNKIAELVNTVNTLSEQRKLYRYKPYGHPDTLCPDGKLWKFYNERGEWVEWSNRPWQLEFHEAGKDHQERMLMAANRPGKTVCAAFEVAFHMTGEYPDWWKGKRFNKPVNVWTGSPTNETSRDIVQKELLGGTSKEKLGTGAIPFDKILGKPKMRQAGVSDVVDQFKVRHKSGGVSWCTLKTYEQGWRKWQGTAPDVVWMDEEPDTSAEQKRIYTEALTRLLTSHGIMMVTFTPLLGQTDLVMHFTGREGGDDEDLPQGDGIWLGTATWDDAPHLNKLEMERLKRSYPAHEVGARTKGVPMMGEGRIFTVDEEEIKVEPFEIPHHYARINGLDFGMDHPTAMAFVAWDRDRDIIYVYDTYKARNKEPVLHAEAMKRAGTWIPVAWPHDGERRAGPADGDKLKDVYRKHGLNMLSKSARYKTKEDKGGAQPQWPIINEIQERISTGRFYVFSTCRDFFEEYRVYHTNDGKIVDRNDDVLKAAFYAVMMKRYASTQNAYVPKQVSSPILSMRH